MFSLFFIFYLKKKANNEVEKDARLADYECQIKNYKLKIKELLKDLRICQSKLKDEQSK